MKKLLIFTLLLVLSLMVTLALAQDGTTLARFVLGGGASDSTAGEVINLRATLGQPVVGVIMKNGGDVTLGQGFWYGGALSGGGYEIFLTLILK